MANFQVWRITLTHPLLWSQIYPQCSHALYNVIYYYIGCLYDIARPINTVLPWKRTPRAAYTNTLSQKNEPMAIFREIWLVNLVICGPV